jgi:hypothetical protein
MQVSNLLDAAACLSTARWRPYRDLAPSTDEAAAGRYAWNIALSESLYPSLHILEIALRNRTFAAGQTLYVTTRHNGVRCWLDSDPAVLLKNAQDEVTKSKRRLYATLRRKYGVRWRQWITPDGLIAELSFGFWTYLYTPAYAASPDTPGKLWPQLLPVVFPNLPPQTQRADVEARLKAARELRNRVFHYEPIWNDAGLASTHRGIVELCEWLSTPLHTALMAFDGFPHLNRPSIERYLRREVVRAIG